ncbi:MAG TPA: hypothetical protein VNB22_17700 [Pyrinomonadaceae bacterium]|nr:hypothetical protein [Pyrinomonadaceae bacterium]
MKTRIIFLSFILLVLSANVFAQKQSAAAQVESFYKFHRARPDIFKASEVNLYKKWFTAELIRLFANELKREKEYLKQNPTDKPHFGDGFPFLPFEECSSGGKLVKNVLKTGAETIRKSVAIVEVQIYQPKQCGGELIETYKIELIQSKGVWLINDWIYADGKRLTADLKRAEY